MEDLVGNSDCIFPSCAIFSLPFTYKRSLTIDCIFNNNHKTCLDAERYMGEIVERCTIGHFQTLSTLNHCRIAPYAWILGFQNSY